MMMDRDAVLALCSGRAQAEAAVALQISSAALELFAYGQAEAAKRGLLLVDTKYEFGRDSEGTIRLIDEILTPDSSRHVPHTCALFPSSCQRGKCKKGTVGLALCVSCCGCQQAVVKLPSLTDSCVSAH